MTASRPRPVALLAGRDPRTGGCGHSHYVRVHARAALAAGYEPHIFCLAGAQGTIQTDFGTIHASPWGLLPSDSQKMAPLHAARLASGVARFVQARPETRVLHGFGVWGYAGLRTQRLLAQSGLGTASIVSLYTSYVVEHRNHVDVLSAMHGWRQRLRQVLVRAWVDRVVSMLERRSVNDSTLVTLNYRSVQRDLGKVGCRPRQLRLLPYTTELAFTGVDSGDASSLRRTLAPDGVPLIVSLSRQVPKKGIDVLLYALAALRDSGLEFRACVLGKGECLDVHIRLAQKLDLGSRVMFPGYVPRVEDYLRSADIFVLPSLHEESGSLALIEALQCGAAVVASAVDGIPEDICHDDNGLLVEPGDAQTLAGALGALLGDESYRRRLAAGGKRLFEERFSSAAFSAALARTYGEAESWVDADGRGANEAYRGVAYP